MSKTRQVVLNMLLKRKYLVEDQDDFLSSTEEQFMFDHKTENQKIYVFFPRVSTKVGVGTIRQYIKEMKDNNVGQSIIIVKDSITAFAKQVFDEAKPSIMIEYFKENELMMDKLDHILVPEHELLSEEEKKELLTIYKLKESQLPKILNSDPVSKYFGARKGQVFRIFRKSETCGDYIYYRIVV